MSTPAKIYVNGIKKKLRNYWAAWLPTSKFNLGDVGVLDGKFFMKVSSLQDLGIDFDRVEDKDPSPIDYVSESGVSVVFKITGELNDSLPNIPQTKAGIGIDFSKQGAYIVQAAETYEHYIKDIVALQGKIIPAYQEGKWDKKWTVITKIIESPRATFLISNSSESKIELSAESDLNMGLAELGNAKASFSVKSQKGDVMRFIGAQNVSPFFQLARIKRRFWGAPKFSTLSLGAEDLFGFISPEMARDEEISKSLYLDLVQDSEGE